MNYRYFHKRAYYLACIASGIEEAHQKEYAINFTHQNDNHLQPIIVINLCQGRFSRVRMYGRLYS